MKGFLTAIALIAMSSATMAADLGPSCTEYFKQLDQVASATMKSQSETAKEQVASMPAATQEAVCKQASDMLKQAMATTPAN